MESLSPILGQTTNLIQILQTTFTISFIKNLFTMTSETFAEKTLLDRFRP